jgi:hypothetical protein
MFLHLRRCEVGLIGRDLRMLSVSNVSGGRWDLKCSQKCKVRGLGSEGDAYKRQIVKRREGEMKGD